MNALTVLAKIKPGQEENLSRVLTTIDESPGDNGIFHVSEDIRTHCARWVIVADAERGPRLLMACEYDGDLKSYLQYLIQISPGLDEIWGKCEGYTGREHFEDFVLDNYYETQAFYIAFRDETVESVRDKIAVRRIIEDLLDDYPSLTPVLEVLRRLPAPQSLWQTIRRTYHRVRTAFHDWWLTGLIKIITPITQLGQTTDYPLVPELEDINAGRKLNRLDGQMITITDIKPGRYPRLRLALAANEFLGKYGYAPGQFANVGTLHSFRWVLIDGGKRLIFLSVFDGTWENYMGDFIDKIIWALDGVYNNTQGYPPGGMRQINAFQPWILNHQYSPELFYKTYPGESVLNLIKDREINGAAAEQLWQGLRLDSENVKPWLNSL